MKRDVTVVVFCLFIAILLLGQVMAITGSMGNARMILRLEKGETIEKYILVKNVNDIPLTIELTTSGDLEDYIEIKDDNFELGAGKEKKAYFTIKAGKSGTTTTNINVAFTPEEGSGVGLSSTIIVIARGEGSDEEIEGTEEEIENQEISEPIKQKITQISGAVTGLRLGMIQISLMITTLILIILTILLIVYFSKTKKGKTKPKRRVKKRE